MAKGGSGKVISMAEKMYIKQLYEDGVSKRDPAEDEAQLPYSLQMR